MCSEKFNQKKIDDRFLIVHVSRIFNASVSANNCLSEERKSECGPDDPHVYSLQAADRHKALC